MKVKIKSIAVWSVVILAGCSGPPSESDGRNALEEKIRANSNGLIRLASFQKTNGIAQEIEGMKLYEMEYTADIEFLEDCVWSGTYRGEARLFYAEPRGQRKWFGAFEPASKGQHQRLTGRFSFQKAEKGWRLSQ